MTAPVRSKDIDQIAKALSPIVHGLLVEQLHKHRSMTVSEVEAEIAAAAKELGRALDELARAKFTAREPGARIRLEKIATRMRRVMQKHGRLP